MSDHTRQWRMRRSTTIVDLAIIALAAGLGYTTSAFGVPLDQIPSPRPTGWMVDLTGRVSPDTINALDSLASEVHKQTGAELAVVVIGSTDGAVPRQFATDLFNRWRIGQAGGNDGVLVFAALDDRKAEIILGDGIDDETHVQASREILQGIVLPKFKAGDPGGAVFHGARACAERILGMKLAPLHAEIQEAARVPQEKTALPPAHAELAPPVPPATQKVPPTPQARKPAARRIETGGSNWLLFGVGGTGLAGGVVFGARKFLRHRTRRCPACRGDMTRLGEAADDEYLTRGEQTEERLGSVDYDVWACGTCRETLKFRYSALFTRFSRCPMCKALTKSTTKRTARVATYSRGGLVEVEDSCHNCSYLKTRPHLTPRLTDTTAASTSIWSSLGSDTGFSGAPSSFDAGISSPPPSIDAGFSGGHSSGGGW